MFLRFIIWCLLISVPIQSFAAVGLIQCQAPGAETSRAFVKGSPSPDILEEGTVAASAPGHSHLNGIGGLSGVPKYPLKSSSEAHHFHKLPCCSDAAIIFSYAIPGVPASEQFLVALYPEADDLASVFLEGPMRPPRLLIS